MAGTSLFALLDDIAALLDDIAVMAKVAAKKAAGVLGDDLALNADQVSGVNADRELPVVWAVFIGSLKNKLILTPAALAISYFIPWLILPLLMLGGAFLCYEGFEKLAHKFLHTSEEDEVRKNKTKEAICTPEVDMVVFEKEKIKGAIRTDFILSAEIIVITLGTVKAHPFLHQSIVVTLIAFSMTLGVYGLVACIVKLDDLGLFLLKDASKEIWGKIKRSIGYALLWLAPLLMKTLTIVGTAAMFLVGGGILAHGIEAFELFIHHCGENLKDYSNIKMINTALIATVPEILKALAGLIAGALIFIIIGIFNKIKSSLIHEKHGQ